MRSRSNRRRNARAHEDGPVVNPRGCLGANNVHARHSGWCPFAVDRSLLVFVRSDLRSFVGVVMLDH